MPSCAFLQCTNHSRRKNKTHEITFHAFPSMGRKDREKWIKFVQNNRSEESWLPNDHTYVCSVHFREEDKYNTKEGRLFLKKCAVPCIDVHKPGSSKDLDDSTEFDIKDEESDTVHMSGSSEHLDISTKSDVKDAESDTVAEPTEPADSDPLMVAEPAKPADEEEASVMVPKKKPRKMAKATQDDTPSTSAKITRSKTDKEVALVYQRLEEALKKNDILEKQVKSLLASNMALRTKNAELEKKNNELGKINAQLNELFKNRLPKSARNEENIAAKKLKKKQPNGGPERKRPCLSPTTPGRPQGSTVQSEPDQCSSLAQPMPSSPPEPEICLPSKKQRATETDPLLIPQESIKTEPDECSPLVQNISSTSSFVQMPMSSSLVQLPSSLQQTPYPSIILLPVGAQPEIPIESSVSNVSMNTQGGSKSKPDVCSSLVQQMPLTSPLVQQIPSSSPLVQNMPSSSPLVQNMPSTSYVQMSMSSSLVHLPSPLEQTPSYILLPMGSQVERPVVSSNSNVLTNMPISSVKSALPSNSNSVTSVTEKVDETLTVEIKEEPDDYEQYSILMTP